MTRDHLMGYPGNVEGAACLEETGYSLEDFSCPDAYPFGIPKRVRKEWAAHYADPVAAKREAELDNFETLNHALPDGSVIPARARPSTQWAHPRLQDIIAQTLQKRADSLREVVEQKNRLLKETQETSRGPLIAGQLGTSAAIGGAILGQRGSSLRGAEPSGIVVDELKQRGYDLLHVPAEQMISGPEWAAHAAAQLQGAGVARCELPNGKTLEIHAASAPMIISTAEDRSPSIVQAYMAGYGQQRADITQSERMSATEKAQAWNEARRAQLKANDEQRYLQAMAARQPGHDTGLQGSRNSPWHTETIKPEGPIVQATPWHYHEEPLKGLDVWACAAAPC